MKYLRRTFLCRNAVTPVLHGFQPATYARFRTFRRLPAVSRNYKFSNPSISVKRRVSTSAGPRKNSLAIVGQSVHSQPLPPSPQEVSSLLAAAPCKFRDSLRSYVSGSEKLPQMLSAASATMCYSEFLGSHTSKASYLDPLSIETVFLPTFRLFHKEFGILFNDPEVSSAAVENQLDTEKNTVTNIQNTVTNIQNTVTNIHSWDNDSHSNSVKSPSAVHCSDNGQRLVQKDIVLPRKLHHLSSQERLKIFFDVHRFEENEPDSREDIEKKDISGFPTSSDHTILPTGQFIIGSDRSALIINKDLYITNRILDKLKKGGKDQSGNTPTTPDPVVKASASVCDIRKAHGISASDHRSWMPKHSQIDNDIKLDSTSIYKKNFERQMHHSKSDTDIQFDHQFASQAETLDSTLNKDLSNSRVPDDYSNNFKLDGSLSESVAKELHCPSEVETPENFSVSHNIHPAPDALCSSFLSNVEFSKVKEDRLSRLESTALIARKNMYTRLMRSTPCYLVDGFHVRDGNGKEKFMPDQPEEGFVANQGESKVTNQPLCLSENSDGIAHWEDYHLNDNLLTSKNPSNEWVEISNTNEKVGELEDWFVPLSREMDSMLMTLFTETTANETNEFLGSCQLSNSDTEAQFRSESEADRTDFKDCVDKTGTFDESKIIGLEILSKDKTHFGGSEGIASGLISSHNPPTFTSTGGRSNSNSSSQAPPPKQQNPNVHIKTETTIKCLRSGDTTDINVTETQRYLDKRLPYPFSTETILQVCGTNDSLHKAVQAVENSKAQLVHLSNANSTNPGMSIPKLQFNHMLTKAHADTNLNASSKKRVFKINLVSDSSSTIPSRSNINGSSSEPSSISTILQIPKQQKSEVTRDALELMKRSKYANKQNFNKMKRGDTKSKLRSKKKHRGDDVAEPVTVLSPKELEKMFPTPPKPKPVEKPRQVTINTKDAKVSYSSVNMIEASKGVGRIALKAKVKADEWIQSKSSKSSTSKLPTAKKNPANSLQVKTEKEPSSQMTRVSLKGESGSGLSHRDEKILKSIISHKVKENFDAVRQHETSKRRNVTSLNESLRPRAADGVGEKLETEVSEIKKKETLRPAPNKEVKIVDPFPPYEQAKPLDSLVGGLNKDRGQRKSTESLTVIISPTPLEKREFVTVKRAELVNHEDTSKIVDDLKLAGKKLQSESKSPLPSERRSGSDYLPKTKLINYSEDKLVVNTPKPNIDKFSHSVKQNFHLMYEPLQSKYPKNTDKNINENFKSSAVSPMRINTYVKRKDVLTYGMQEQASEPIFFPFETPSVKELLLTSPFSLPGKTLPLERITHDLPRYEADFCKLSKESKLGLEFFSLAPCKVPLTRVKEFPMVNSSKEMKYSVPSGGVISINTTADVTLREALSKMPAVTKVLGQTLTAKSQQALDRWKQGLIQTLGEQGFQEFYENQLRNGSNFHSAVSKFLLGLPDGKDDLCMKSMAHVFPMVSDVGVVESQVVHPQLAYRGVIDCVAKYKGKPVLIEWKRAEKPKSSIKHTYDAPLQLCAYLGALNYDNNYKLQVEGGLIVVAYSNGSPADVFEISLEECEQYWTKWLKRLYKFYARS